MEDEMTQEEQMEKEQKEKKEIFIREQLEEEYGEVWTAQKLQEDFFVHNFIAPFCQVTRKSDGKTGVLEFIHMPRLYYNFMEDNLNFEFELYHA